MPPAIAAIFPAVLLACSLRESRAGSPESWGTCFALPAGLPLAPFLELSFGLRVDAQTLLGGFLKFAEKAKGKAGPGRGKAGSQPGPASSDAPTLADLGVSKNCLVDVTC
jgi:hypothetical protein